MSVRHRSAIGCAILSATTACALRASPPMALHADLTYPRTRNEACSREGPASLRVEVTDQLNAGLPQVSVYLIPMPFVAAHQDVPWNAVAAYSDRTGVATFPDLGQATRYTAVASMPGFMPEVRAIEVPPGCSGTLTVILRIASRARLDALNAGRPVE